MFIGLTWQIGTACGAFKSDTLIMLTHDEAYSVAWATTFRRSHADVSRVEGPVTAFARQFMRIRMEGRRIWSILMQGRIRDSWGHIIWILGKDAP
jgi:hypothetical protein